MKEGFFSFFFFNTLSLSLSLSHPSLPHQPFVSACLLFVCWLLIVPATCECISGTDLHRQVYVLPH